MSARRRGRSQDSASDWSIGSHDHKDTKIGDKLADRSHHSENEAFLQSFEKPTQIYRYLRTRHLVSPIFLNRNLYYMKHRLNRSRGKRRRDFSVDIGSEDYSAVTVETSLLKMGHQKRKDVLAPVYQYLVGSCDIQADGDDEVDICQTVYKSELCEQSNAQIVKQWSYSLLFIVSFHAPQLNGNCVESDKQENDMSLMNDNTINCLAKRRRLDDAANVSYFKTELVIYDKHQNCHLTDGEYTAVLQPCAPPKANKFGKYGKYSKWQEISAEDVDSLSLEDPNKQYGSMEVFRKGPVLKFKLSWSSNQPSVSINGLNHCLSNNNENDSGIGNNMSDNSSNQSYNGCLSSTGGSLKHQGNGLSPPAPKKSFRVIYQFLFNNNTRQQTKPQNDLCCPWCSLNCQLLYSLIKHLKLCHSRFVFNYVPDIKCARIDVAINECYDGSYAGNPLDLSVNTGFAFSRNGPVRRNPVTHVIVCHPKRYPHCLSEFDEPDDEDGTNGRTYISGHNRLYYHTDSCLPIRPQEMDYDSEAENDPKWMKEKTQMMIDEFTDVNEGEKEVMKMWNLHIMSNGFVGDCQIQLACTMFVEQKGDELIAKNLYKNFVLHLNNLCDFGILNAASFAEIVKTLNQKQMGCDQQSRTTDDESRVGAAEANVQAKRSTIPFRSNSSSMSTFGNRNVQKITFGAILPKTLLITLQRQYYKRLLDAVEGLLKKHQAKYNFTNYYQIAESQVVLLPLAPSPTEILSTVCNQLLVKNITTILYMTNSEIWGSNAASAQYLMQLTGYIGIPVIAWNADNIGLDQRGVDSRILQLAPSVEHQASAMLSILRRYSWHVFSIVTSDIGGHDHFIRAVRDKVLSIDDFRFNILDIYIIKKNNKEEIMEELLALSVSEARVLLLYSTKEEAFEIMAAAEELKMTGKNYMWIVTQSVLGGGDKAPGSFPPGMLGVHFNTTHQRLLDEMERAVTIFGHGLELFVNDQKNLNLSLSPNLSCHGSAETRWSRGDIFFNYLRNISVKTKHDRFNLEFNADGTLKYVELDIMNLNNIGIWDKFSLKVSFLEEPPFINSVPPNNETGECEVSRAVRCKITEPPSLGGNKSSSASRVRYSCCAGFCIDLLQKFADDLKFTYELNRVEDGAWGVLINGSWNGLIADLLNHRADIVVTSIKINSDRQKYVDFTVPFLETGIAIVVAKRTGIISPKAFLEPFDTISWIMILLISIQVSAFAIFLFEWLSPSGYDMNLVPPRDHKFSLFRTYWLVWAILFGAAVHVDCPKGYTARFMANTWATFAVVFLAIYTANLAAFMITREEYHDFTGLEDRKLQNPRLHDPPLRFGTLPYGNTEAVLKQNKPKMHAYMKPYNKTSPIIGVQAVKKGELDAFIYDAVVLDHLVGDDSDCGLLTVGSWYAMTGYGFSLPKNSKYLERFNKKMIEYRESGDLERLRRFWFQGACKSQKNKRNISKPLDINQFMSAFLLLGCGILLTVVLLALEHLYFRYCRQHLAKTDRDGCFTLVSLSMARSLKFPQNDGRYTYRHCNDPICDTKRRLTLQELDVTKSKLRQLQSESTSSDMGPQNKHYLHINSVANESYSKARDMTRTVLTTNDPTIYGPKKSKAVAVSEFETNCFGPEVNEIVSAIFHSIVFYRCYGKFHYKHEDSYSIGTLGYEEIACDFIDFTYFHYKHEDSYSIGTLGYEEIACDFIDFTYVRISSPQLIATINKEIKEFVDKLRQENSHTTTGAISLEFYSRRRGRWPFNDAPLVWEIWTVKVNCDRDRGICVRVGDEWGKGMANCHWSLTLAPRLVSRQSNESQQKGRIEELLLEKLVTIVQIMNSSKSYLPQMPNQQHSDTIFETNYTDVQPYIFKISHSVGAAANTPMMATQGTGDGSAIKKFFRETLAL
ncbi:unnamed protein product [Oppiella nova]|uniref:Autophagy-related protein 101 n=1 Tax=Oppiella nova TaxID=334625 RepID=A0A7R9LC97_9ACAR|nr:unnamed protein product [Oppiella nova]CAG2162128.1 unnamed protein product [Oppiella nova]